MLVLQGLVVLGSRAGRGVLLKALARRPADDSDLDSHFSAAGEVTAEHILTTGQFSINPNMHPFCSSD